MQQHIGRFQPGNPGGPGRPPRDKELAILGTIKQEATPERVSAVLGKLYDQVLSHGSVKAAELWLRYTVGKPPEAEQNTPSSYEWAKSFTAHIEGQNKRIAELEAQLSAKTIEVN